MSEHKVYYINRKGKKYEIILDDEGLKLWEKYSWTPNKTFKNGTSYFTRNKRKYINKKPKAISIALHRVIAKAKKGEHVDHIDGNIMNNKKSNLRICTSAENSRNHPGRKRKKSIYKGLTLDKGKWKPTITLKGKMYTLGLYTNEHVAAYVRNLYLKKIHKNYAWYNNLPKDINKIVKEYKKDLTTKFQNRYISKIPGGYEVLIEKQYKKIFRQKFTTIEKARSQRDSFLKRKNLPLHPYLQYINGDSFYNKNGIFIG